METAQQLRVYTGLVYMYVCTTSVQCSLFQTPRTTKREGGSVCFSGYKNRDLFYHWNFLAWVT